MDPRGDSPISHYGVVSNSTASSSGSGAGGLPLTSSLTPSTLHQYLAKPDIQILLLDVRNREAFDEEHIKSNGIVCLDPFVLAREG